MRLQLSHVAMYSMYVYCIYIIINYVCMSKCLSNDGGDSTYMSGLKLGRVI